MRAAYADERAEFARVISIVKDFKQLQPGMISLLQRLDTVGKDCDLQKAGLQEIGKRVDAQMISIFGVARARATASITIGR